MPLVVKDRVRETSTTTGTGTFTLAGAVTGYQSFSAVGNGNTTYYTIYLQGGNEWEVGIGTYTASGTTLSRDTILASSNGGSAVNFSAGVKDVFVTYPAGRSVYYDTATNVTLNALTLSGGTQNGVLYLNGSRAVSSGSSFVFDSSLAFLGMGGVTPDARISIAAPMFASSATAGTIRFKDVGTADSVLQSYYVSTEGTDINLGSNAYVATSGSFTRFDATKPSAYINVARSGNITFATGSGLAAEALRITSGGQVNIGGNFTSTNNTLQVTGSPAKVAIGYTAAAPSDGLIVAGNVGIGTDNPGSKLDVSGANAGTVLAARILNTSTSASSDAQQFIYVNGATAGDAYTTWTVGGVTSWSGGIRNSDSDSWYLSPGSNLGTSPAVVVTTSGNLGLGVTPSTWASGQVAIELGGNVGNLAFNSAGATREGYLYWNSFYNGTNTLYKANGFAIAYGNNNGEHRWFNAPSWNGTGSNIASFTQAMTLDTSGNLVIGDTAGKANSRITLYRNNSATDFFAANPTLSLQNSNSTNNAGSWIGNYDSTGKNNSYVGFVNIDQNYAGAIVFGTSNSGATNYGERARIDSSGTLILRQSSNAANTSVSFNTTVQNALTLDSSGNLLVGTTTLDNKVTLSSSSSGAAAGVLSLVNPNDATSTAADLEFVTHSSGTLATGRIRGLVGGADNYPMSFWTYGASGLTEKMRIAAGGNVGIGETNPAVKLDVVGASQKIAKFFAQSSYGQLEIGTTGANQNVYLTLSPNGTGLGIIQHGTGDVMKFDASGNLGLGVTPSAWNGSYKALDMGSGAIMARSAGSDIYFTQNAIYGVNGFWIYNYNSTGAARYEQVSGVHAWYNAPSGTVNSTTIVSGRQYTIVTAGGNFTAFGAANNNVGTVFTATSSGTASGGGATQTIVFTQAMTLDANGALNVAGATNVPTINLSDTFGDVKAQFLCRNSTTGNVEVTNTKSAALVFGTNNTERARITSGGDFLLGGTVVANSTGGMTITVGAGGSVSAPLALRNPGTANGSGVLMSFRGSTNLGAENDYAYLSMVADDTTAKTGSIRFSTGNGGSPAERARIDASGNLVVGATSTSSRFEAVAGTGAQFIGTFRTGDATAANNAGGGFYGISSATAATREATLWLDADAGNFTGLDYFYIQKFGNSGVVNIVNYSNAAMTFYTNAAERARITSGGDFRVKGAGTAGSTDAFQISGSAPADAARLTSGGDLLIGSTTDVAQRVRITYDNVTPQWGMKMHSTATSGDNNFIEFGTEASFTVRGSITYNRAGGAIAYNTTSDYRAKDIIGPVQNSGQVIDALKVYTGKMKGATLERPMLVAHEAQEHVPYAVTGEKDAVNEDGTPKYQQMDVASLVPLLLAEIQSLRARVAQLESKGI